MMQQEHVSRRVFLRHSTMVTAGVVSGGVLSEGCVPERRVESPGGQAGSPSGILNPNPQMA